MTEPIWREGVCAVLSSCTGVMFAVLNWSAEQPDPDLSKICYVLGLIGFWCFYRVYLHDISIPPLEKDYVIKN